jgi:hypothetical protein
VPCRLSQAAFPRGGESSCYRMVSRKNGMCSYPQAFEESPCRKRMAVPAVDRRDRPVLSFSRRRRLRQKRKSRTH